LNLGMKLALLTEAKSLTTESLFSWSWFSLFRPGKNRNSKKGSVQMEQNSRKAVDENARKLVFIVVLLSMFVVALFGFAPLV
jgi:hypothetical protein